MIQDKDGFLFLEIVYIVMSLIGSAIGIFRQSEILLAIAAFCLGLGILYSLKADILELQNALPRRKSR